MNPNRTDIVRQFYTNNVIDKILNMSCSNMTNKPLTYNFSESCNLIGLYEIKNQCQKYLAPAHKNNTATTIILYNIPISCPWYGMGTTGGINSNNTIWIVANRLFPILGNTLLHELGHTWGLEHSHSINWEYGDCSCIMGCANTINTCFNAFNSNKLGWSTSLFPPIYPNSFGSWTNYLLPVFTKQYNNHIIINVSDIYNIFLSLRSSQGRSGVDTDILNLTSSNYNGTFVPFQNAISVHLTTQTASTFISAIQVGEILDVAKALFIYKIYIPKMLIEHYDYSQEKLQSIISLRFDS
jgi:hypothetical protein